MNEISNAQLSNITGHASVQEFWFTASTAGPTLATCLPLTLMLFLQCCTTAIKSTLTNRLIYKYITTVKGKQSRCNKPRHSRQTTEATVAVDMATLCPVFPHHRRAQRSELHHIVHSNHFDSGTHYHPTKHFSRQSIGQFQSKEKPVLRTRTLLS